MRNDFWITDTFEKTYLSHLDSVTVVMALEGDAKYNSLEEWQEGERGNFTFTTPQGNSIQLDPVQFEWLCWVWLAFSGVWKSFQGSYHRAMARIQEEGYLQRWVDELEKLITESDESNNE